MVMEHPPAATTPDRDPGTPSPVGPPSPEGPPSAMRPPSAMPRRTVPSARPALIVVGIAAGLLVLFGIGAALTGSPKPATPSKSATAPVKGATLKAESAAPILRPIERPGTPPSDVLGAVVVPAGSAAVSSKPWDGTTQFSGKMTFRLRSSQAAVVEFYKAELRSRGWSISSVGAAEGTKNATEVLAQRASTDGWYWEIGVVVLPTRFTTASGSGAAASSSDTTRFTLDLFQEPETG